MASGYSLRAHCLLRAALAGCIPPLGFVYRFIIDADARLALVELTGDLTVDDFVGAAREVHAHPDWAKGFDAIWDGREIDSLSLAPEDIDRLVAVHLDGREGRVYILVRRDLDYIVSRLYSVRARAKGGFAGVYHSMRDALDAMKRDALPESLRAWRRAQR